MLASQEQAQATEALLQRWPCVDRQRVGVWGWSGGGSMSLNAIFRYPDLFHVAVAVASVPNQLLYDTIYQERYMGLPEDNAEGYRLGSPLTHAKNLKGDLMIIHGTGDDNCHYQGTDLLINELITHNKQFSVMPYPGRSHSISEGNNTVRHFYATIAKYFDTHLKQRPAD
jgi:dipeptidyl-peptidase-4